jgi:hypothetical protein
MRALSSGPVKHVISSASPSDRVVNFWVESENKRPDGRVPESSVPSSSPDLSALLAFPISNAFRRHS